MRNASHPASTATWMFWNAQILYHGESEPLLMVDGDADKYAQHSGSKYLCAQLGQLLVTNFLKTTSREHEKKKHQFQIYLTDLKNPSRKKAIQVTFSFLIPSIGSNNVKPRLSCRIDNGTAGHLTKDVFPTLTSSNPLPRSDKDPEDTSTTNIDIKKRMPDRGRGKWKIPFDKKEFFAEKEVRGRSIHSRTPKKLTFHHQQVDFKLLRMYNFPKKYTHIPPGTASLLA